MADAVRQSGRSARAVVTLTIAAIFAAVIAFVRLPTSLGVKVPRPETIFTEPDLSGREYIWRVWWRARDDLIDAQPQWLVTGGLIALLAIFALGTLLAIWLVTGPPARDKASTRDG
jgi:hypothetical protein